MRSDPKLKRLFRLYNRRYFEGKLPSRSTRVEFADGRHKEFDPTLAGRCICYPNNTALILVHSDLRVSGEWAQIKLTLLHEMVHLSGVFGHGPAFEREMRRLASLGAFARRGNQPSLW